MLNGYVDETAGSSFEISFASCYSKDTKLHCLSFPECSTPVSSSRNKHQQRTLAHSFRGTRYDRVRYHQVSADRNKEMVSIGNHWRCFSIDICIAHPCRGTKYQLTETRKWFQWEIIGHAFSLICVMHTCAEVRDTTVHDWNKYPPTETTKWLQEESIGDIFPLTYVVHTRAETQDTTVSNNNH